MGREAKIVAKFRERIEGRKASGKRKAVPGIPGVVVYKNHGSRFSSNGRPDIEVTYCQMIGAATRIEPAITVFLEFKAPGEKPTAIQTQAHDRLRKAGALVFVVDSVEGALEVLRKNGLRGIE